MDFGVCTTCAAENVELNEEGNCTECAAALEGLDEVDVGSDGSDDDDA